MKKIYYVPGLISALLIPVLFWFYGNQKYREINLNVIDIQFPPKSYTEKATAFDNFETYRKLDYKRIEVKPNTARKIPNYTSLKSKNCKKSTIENLE